MINDKREGVTVFAVVPLCVPAGARASVVPVAAAFCCALAAADCCSNKLESGVPVEAAGVGIAPAT